MKGIREAALSKDDEPTYTLGKRYTGHLDDNYDVYDSYNPHQNSMFRSNYQDKPKANSVVPDDFAEYELHDGEFEINLVVSMTELGTKADPDRDDFEFDLMNQAAQDVGLIKLEKLIPDLYKNYKITTSSLENLDDVTVTLKLKPIEK